MSFSEKMRESLGAEGVRLQVQAPSEKIAPGQTARVLVTVSGGTRPARVDALVVRVIEADRHWIDEQGARVSEEEAQALPDRRHLTAGWDRLTLGRTRVELEADLDPGTRREVEVEVEVPDVCRASSVNRAHTLSIQADIKGQIDPTANARILVAES